MRLKDQKEPSHTASSSVSYLVKMLWKEFLQKRSRLLSFLAHQTFAFHTPRATHMTILFFVKLHFIFLSSFFFFFGLINSTPPVSPIFQ